ncbi:MAG: ergothioneine biosynthesis protein EgtB, partial [Sphingobacteriales bacterium]
MAARFLYIRQQTEEFCSALQKEDYVVQPVVDVSPPKWHLAHTTWFFENFILKPFKKNYREFDKDYCYLFNSYYETVGKRVVRSDRGNLTRPGVDDVYKYRDYVNNEMAEMLLHGTDKPDEMYHILELGLQHEQQHHELLITDTKYILGHNPLFPALFGNNASLQAPKNTPQQPEIYVEVAPGIYDIGCQQQGFCFDNELGVHKVYLSAFRILNRLVTNAEYLEFIRAGGYADFKYWLQEGWAWVNENKITAPLYWHQINGEWYYYTLNGLQPIDANAPVTHVSFYEADAFARWKGMRLPTEFEWEVACRRHCPEAPENANFSDTKSYQPQPAQDKEWQLWGDCWEWTNSAYLPYPFYKTAEGALGEYNGKF